MSAEQTVVPQEPDQADYDPVVRVYRSLGAMGFVLGMVFSVALLFGLERLHQGSFGGDVRAHLRTEVLARPTGDVLYLYFSSAIGAGLAGLLMVGCIGAMNLRKWSRPVLLLWGIAALLLGVAEACFTVRWLFPPWRDDLPLVRGVIDILSNLGGVGLMATLAGPMVYLLTRDRVKDALR